MSLDPAAVLPPALRRKVAGRILPLIFVLYVIAYLDRMNIGYAKIRMQSALGWSDDVVGWDMSSPRGERNRTMIPNARARVRSASAGDTGRNER